MPAMSSYISWNTPVTVAKYAAGTGVFASTVAMGSLWYYQRSLIYPSTMPEGSRKEVPTPAVVGLPFEDVFLTTSDGVKIRGYFIPAREKFTATAHVQSMNPQERKEDAEAAMKEWEAAKASEKGQEFVKSRPTIVIFHANAGNMGHRVPIARKFNTDLRCNVFMLSYRGYGLSEGVASEKGIHKDVASAIEYLESHPLLKHTKIISIGGAVSLWAASKWPQFVSGVIIENTFLSLPKLVPSIIPQIPYSIVNLLLSDRWDAQGTMPHIPPATPVLLLSGQKDELVPPEHMRKLKVLRGEGKAEWHEFENGHHNDTYLCAGYWDIVAEWLRTEFGE